MNILDIKTTEFTLDNDTLTIIQHDYTFTVLPARSVVFINLIAKQYTALKSLNLSCCSHKQYPYREKRSIESFVHCSGYPNVENFPEILHKTSN